ncbi:FHA domain protein [Duganella sp. CF458]|uniref:type VI secretion system-associated FHA domain protein TagH n=1 Tax=Duganella sp. CF458 TaxID=1884368 RepID=UPI0008E73976|nr:type VI secretion system-associated FHA domain protein TagH [Duganella sp. CF458]SFG09768.1 FHA domain protein [Duganella sp. CF458]
MIMIKAVSFNGQPLAADLGAAFGEAGGVIGRGNGNALVLPDPERFVSRAHAAIAFHAGTYVIRDLSSASPVYVNGIPLGNGREARLAYGDELRIGAYALQVLPQAAPGASSLAGTPVDDPLGLFEDSVAAGQPEPRKADRPPGGIPEDFDPFADVESAKQPLAAQAQPPSIGDDFRLGLEPASSSDINQLFGLGNNAGGSLFPDGHPLAEQSADAGYSDPLVALGAVPLPQPGANSQRDDALEIHAAFAPPPVAIGNEQKARQDIQGRPTSPRQGPAVAQAAPMGPVVSWDVGNEQDSGGIKTMVMRSPAKPSAERANAAQKPAAATAVPAPEVALPLASAAPVARESEAALLQAFLEGAGVPDLEIGTALTPDMMAMFGQLLRQSTKGTLDLLMARSLTKREMHAQMTVIAMRENNPLKFSPNVEVALHSLLAPRGKGFMPPLQAMQDAYDDLRAHQFGVMAGMRAALARVLQRFDPEQLEERLSDRTLADSLLPAHRKARLWAQYLALYNDITKEAEDDFQTWFGREFLSAYEAQMAKLKEDRS